MAGRGRAAARIGTACLILCVLAAASAPASAQNRPKAWEIFIYFGEYGGAKIPSAIQRGMVSTYRLDPWFAEFSDPNQRIPFCEICRNAGATGHTDPSQEDQFFGPPQPSDPFRIPSTVDACPHTHDPNNDSPEPWALDANTPFLDECDDDMEALYLYNARGIRTNGEVQRNDGEFLLGARLGYNLSRHWEVELDLGFAKQRLDMTRNLIPLLTERVSNPADPFFSQLADFYVFTWANVDFLFLGYEPSFDPTDPNRLFAVSGLREIPNVPQHRFSRNPGADIPAVLPLPLLPSERFDDVTDFVNRIFLDPTAFRNRANQINIDVFSVGLTGVYNFNTRPDSRIVPYLQGGLGRWMRGFDAPYEGEDTNYLTYGGGVRFFVNEIFSFRAELRNVIYRDDEMQITADAPRQNLRDVGAFGACFRDQDPPAQQPPQECQFNPAIDEFNRGIRPRLPRNHGAGGTAHVEFDTKLDDFWEARVGFDVLLGGK